MKDNAFRILVEYLERTRNYLFAGGFGWVIAEDDGDEISFRTMEGVIAYMDEQNKKEV